ncbi:MAG: hypothetical protein APF77_00310 [Clostridia bacterium BRH_c25]|nr:MAG: hypothetical protein APF77_00310 [Clostridia bacterium BRH_c25]
MGKKFKCPMMCGMPMMHQGEPMGMENEMPMVEELEMDNYYADEEDDRQFVKMYPESCKKIMVYVKVEIDRMEEKDEMMHENRPDREMISMMVDNAYKKMVKEMPEMAEEEETRQYPGRRFSRDLLRILLLNELFRRRRRRRRRDYYGYPYGGYDFDYYY